MLNELPHEALQNASVTLPGVTWFKLAWLFAGEIPGATSPVRQHDGMRCVD